MGALLLGPALLVLVAGGCADDSGAAQIADRKEAPAVATSVSSTPAPQAPAPPQATSDDLKSPPTAAETQEVEPAFEYPFPHREDLFLPPTKAPAHVSRPRDDEDVVLMGFADFGGVRAVLKVDGIVTSLRVGESRGEVRVLAIDPPKVDLQRADRRWTESLADTP